MELKANELRIGNLFDEFDDGILAIEEIKKDSDGFKGYYAVFKNNSIKCHTRYLKPIPLTEEWLFRFGYTEKDFSNGNIIKVINGGYIITTLSNKEIKYVHKLQNLYYELKDNELKLK